MLRYIVLYINRRGLYVQKVKRAKKEERNVFLGRNNIYPIFFNFRLYDIKKSA